MPLPTTWRNPLWPMSAEYDPASCHPAPYSDRRARQTTGPHATSLGTFLLQESMVQHRESMSQPAESLESDALTDAVTDDRGGVEASSTSAGDNDYVARLRDEV